MSAGYPPGSRFLPRQEALRAGGGGERGSAHRRTPHRAGNCERPERPGRAAASGGAGSGTVLPARERALRRRLRLRKGQAGAERGPARRHGYPHGAYGDAATEHLRGGGGESGPGVRGECCGQVRPGRAGPGACPGPRGPPYSPRGAGSGITEKMKTGRKEVFYFSGLLRAWKLRGCETFSSAVVGAVASRARRPAEGKRLLPSEILPLLRVYKEAEAEQGWA